MSIVKKDRWTEDEVLALPSGEHDFFDRKSGALLADKDFRKDLAKALSAFSNSRGGHLLLGVKDDGTFDGVPTHKGRQSTREWLEQVAPNLVSYPLQDIRVHEVEPSMPSAIPPGTVVIVIDVGDSNLAPHQSEIDHLYYYRVGGHSKPAPHFYLDTLRWRERYPSREVAQTWCYVILNPLISTLISHWEVSFMVKENIKCAVTSVAVVLALAFLAANGMTTNSRAGGQEAGALDDKPAEQVYKNIQVLRGVKKSQLDGAMNFIATSLGVNCNYCHVQGTSLNNWPWEKDDKPTKQTARRMIRMVFDLNKGTFGGADAVSCYTCHRGRSTPVSTPALATGVQQKPEPKPSAAKPDEPLPTVEQILDRYVQALGGKGALEKLTSRVMKVAPVTANGLGAPVEIYAKAPNKLLTVTATPNGVFYNGFNGSVHWFGTGKGEFEKNYFQLAQVKRDAEFYKPVELKTLFARMAVVGRVRLGESDAYVVEATPADPNPEKLFFDVETGLLVRRYREFRTVLGPIPSQDDYEDYKEVDGVRLPFTIRSANPNSVVTLKVVEVRHNVPVDDESFDRPPKNQ